MAWSSDARRLRLPPDWPARRTATLVRDGYRCRIRGPRCIGHAAEADHIEPGDDHELANLQAACAPCHREKSAREGATRWSAMRTATKHPTERHPGAL